MVPYIITVSGLTFIIEGKPISVASDHGKFDKLVNMLKEGETTGEQLMDVLEEDKRKVEEAIRSADGKLSEALEITDGVLRYHGEALHLYVANKLVDMVRQGFKVTPVVNFIERLLNNPSKRAVDHLYSFLEHGKNPLTEEGKFIAFKAVRADFKDIYTGTLDNSIGKEVQMPRWKVNEDPNQTCSSGLHACSFDYLPSFSHANGHIILVEIDPADVVAIPTDYNNTKMRVCKYKVIGEYADYYQNLGNTLSDTMHTSGAFSVEVRDSDDEAYRVEDSFDNIASAARYYVEVSEDADFYQVRLINTTTGIVLDENTNDMYQASSNDGNGEDEGGEDNSVTYRIRAQDDLAQYKDKNFVFGEADIESREAALETARNWMDDYAIVQVLNSDDEVEKTFGYTE